MERNVRWFITSWITFLCFLMQACGAGLPGGSSAPGAVNKAPSYSGRELIEGVFFGVGPTVSRLQALWGEHGVAAQAREQAVAKPWTRAEIADAVDASVKGMSGAAVSDATMSFLRGLVPAIRNGRSSHLTAEERQGVADAFRGAILDMIAARDPTFYSRFASGLQSGDQVKVERALTEAGDMLLKTVGDLHGSIAKRSPGPVSEGGADMMDVTLELDIAGWFEGVQAGVVWNVIAIYTAGVIALVVAAVVAVWSRSPPPGQYEDRLYQQVLVDDLTTSLSGTQLEAAN